MRFRPADIRPGEKRNVIGAFLTLFGLMAGHAILETARDSLFLAELSARDLPFVYLGIALLALAVTETRHRMRRRSNDPGGSTASRAGLSALLLIAGLVTLGLWGLLGRTGSWILYAVYLWSGLLSTLLLVRFWTLVAEIFTVTQAKRLFAVVGTGSILGAIAGSFSAQRIVSTADQEQLLPAAALLFLLTSCGPFLLRPTGAEIASRNARPVGPDTTPPPESAPPAAGDPSASLASADLGATFRSILRHPYLSRVSGLVFVSTIAITIGDLVFKTAIERVTDPSELGYVFASIYLVVNVLSLVAQVGLVGWMTSRLGVDRVLAFLPALLLLASGGFLAAAIGAGAAAAWAFRPVHGALLLRGLDGTFRHSLHRTSIEVLYVPLAGAWRARVKGFVDVVGQRGGQAVASLVFLGLAAAGASDVVLGGLLVVLCSIWGWLALGIKGPYFDLFRTSLDAEAIRTRVDFPELDLASLETLMAALSSPDDAEVSAALDVLAETERIALIPTLVLYHPSPSVVVRALELFEESGRSDHHAILDRLFDHPAEEVRAAALAAVPSSDADVELFERALADDSADVRSTALVGLLAVVEAPADLHPRVPSILETILHAGSLEAKTALARAIRHRPSPRFEAVLRRLAASPDPLVRAEVAIAMRCCPSEAFLESLLAMLAQRRCRTEARLTLRAIGEPAFEIVAAALADESTPSAVRRHIPRTLSLFDPEPAARILLERLAGDPEGAVRFKILRALGQLRARHPDLALDDEPLDVVIDATLASIFRLIDWRLRFDREATGRPEWRTQSHGLVVELLLHKERHSTERLFRLFGLRHPREDFRRIWRGLQDGPESQASSRELLEHALPPTRRNAVLGLVDDIPDARRLAAGERWHVPAKRSRHDLLTDLLEQGSLHLRILVACHVRELPATDLDESLAGLRDKGVQEMHEALRGPARPAGPPGTDPDGKGAYVVPIR